MVKAGILVAVVLISIHTRVFAQGLAAAEVEEAAAKVRAPGNLDATSLGVFRDAVAAYIYGYPLVAMAMTERVSTTISSATTTQLGRAPINQFYRAQTLPVGSAFKDVVLPSTTTMYAPAFLDLSKEPLILHIPVIPDNRYYIFELLDGWTNVSRASPGIRIDTAPGDYALVGTDRSYKLPSGLTGEIDFDTNTAWIITRIYTTGTDADQKIVAGLFDQITLTPASAYGKPYTVPDNLPVNPSIDILTQPIKQTDSMDACAFFGVMSSMLKTNPPREIDRRMAQRLERLGLIPDEKSQFSCAGSLASTGNGIITPGRVELATLELAVLAAKEIMANAPPPSLTPTNWTVSLNVGDYGLRYLLRALVAQRALGANRPADAVYGYGVFDSTGTDSSHMLNGANNYVVHFNAPTAQQRALEIPPVNQYGFWSVTLYQIDGTLNDNKSATWNALSTTQVQNHTSCPNADGSLDVYVQSTPPADAKQYCNWLEAPQPSVDNSGGFIMFLRLYWPNRSVITGSWYPPAIVRAN